MTNRFDKSRDAASYDAHAGSYDKYIRRLADPLADRICDLARLKPGDRVLDVGTGSGIAARQAARTVGPGGGVLGIDLSAGMIDIARRSVDHWEGKRPEFTVMDAEKLDLPDAAFDAVISLCAVRHFPNIERALAEMRRVLKPGGAFVVSYGHTRPITSLAHTWHMAKRLAGIISRPPQLVGSAYLTRLATRLVPEPTQPIGTEWGSRDPQGTLVRYVRDAGFERVEPSWWGHEVIFESAEEFWEAQTSIVTQIRRRLVEARADDVARLKRAFIGRAEAILRRGGKLIYPYGAFYVTAGRPTSSQFD